MIENQFAPMLSPQEMLRKGIFGGTYFAEIISYEDFPEAWFAGLAPHRYCSPKYLTAVNCFGVRSGQTQREWEAKGWVHADDPRGWFEWYCKYYLGRRHADDARQIKRWLAFCGPKGRWRNTIYAKIEKSGFSVADCFNVSPRIQQSLLHWSYVVNEEDYFAWLDGANSNP